MAMRIRPNLSGSLLAFPVVFERLEDQQANTDEQSRKYQKNQYLECKCQETYKGNKLLQQRDDQSDNDQNAAPLSCGL